VGLLLILSLAAFLRPPAPAPLSGEQAWLVRAGPTLDALATDVAGARAASVAVLERDVRRVRSAGPPPQAAAAARWASALRHVEAAERAPGQARGELAAAGLDLVELTGSGSPG
jgi:hypothetical protein